MSKNNNNTIDKLFEKLDAKCKDGNNNENNNKYNCTMLFYIILAKGYFPNSDTPFLEALAWFNYYLNKKDISCEDKNVISKNKNKNTKTIGKLNNKLIKCLNNSKNVRAFLAWYETEREMITKSSANQKNKTNHIIKPSIEILKKELINIKNIIKPEKIKDETWKFMENYWYIRLIGITILPLNDRYVTLTGNGLTGKNSFALKRMARVTDEDKIISSMKLFHRETTHSGILNSIKSRIGINNDNIKPTYYIMGKLYPDNDTVDKQEGSCDINSSRIMGLVKKGSLIYYQPITSYELACSDTDRKIRARSYKYLIKIKKKIKKITVGNIVFLLIAGKKRIRIIYKDNRKNKLTLEYNITIPPTSNIGIISVSGIDVIEISNKGELISFNITDNAYVMRDQFNIDILGKDTIEMLIHLYPIIQIPNFM